MKKILVIGLLFLAVLSACKKNTDSSEISGSWKVVAIYDKNTATTSFPPAGSNMNIVLSFLGGDRFAGHTLRNTITDGSFKQAGSEISFGSFSMTKINEDQWGGSFLTVLNACSLQSSAPCTPSLLTIQGNTMNIVTALRYNVTLERI